MVMLQGRRMLLLTLGLSLLKAAAMALLLTVAVTLLLTVATKQTLPQTQTLPLMLMLTRCWRQCLQT
jgi:hypothetical protein